MTVQANLFPTPAKPFIIWIGGKRRLLSKISREIPSVINTYFEPFVGGGAVFFALAPHINNAVISDTNVELITTYQVVKEQPTKLIDQLREFTETYQKDLDYFYEVRSKHHLTDPLAIATRMIFLNRTSYNGKYTVNAAGRFSNSRGHRMNACYPEQIQHASNALQKATIVHGDFDEVVKPTAGDFIYADPPYDNTKIKYQWEAFDQVHQVRLRDAADRWREAGASVMLSNSLTDNIKNLYSNYRIQTLKIQYGIDPLSMRARGLSDEALIMSYES